jgi:hypothetical protein
MSVLPTLDTWITSTRAIVSRPGTARTSCSPVTAFTNPPWAES